MCETFNPSTPWGAYLADGTCRRYLLQPPLVCTINIILSLHTTAAQVVLVATQKYNLIRLVLPSLVRNKILYCHYSCRARRGRTTSRSKSVFPASSIWALFRLPHIFQTTGGARATASWDTPVTRSHPKKSHWPAPNWQKLLTRGPRSWPPRSTTGGATATCRVA